MTAVDHTLATRVVLRVLDATGEPVGAGFLLGPDVVATCAHVVADATRTDPYAAVPPEGPVRVDFPLLADGPARSARVVRWLPIAADGTGDIAVLQLDEPAPRGARMPPLRRIDALWDHPFRVLGFPEGLADGVWTTGRIRGEQGTRWFQLQAAVGDQPIVGGFSGSPVWDESTGAVVGMTVATDASGTTTTAYLIPIDQVLGADPELLPCPYRGLEPFDEEHADWFFGRERDIAQVTATLARHPLVTVVGPSGAGKSSLVKAGVIPRLRAEGAVVAQLRPLPGQTADQVLATVPGRADVLVVDQFEELAGAEPEMAQLLLEGFGELVGPPEERTGVRVVLTLRSASLDRIAAPAVAGLLGAGTVLLPPMDRGQLRDAIVAPAERAPGLTFEAGLVDRILDDAAEEPGHLPLVESLLTELWERRSGGSLTVAAYEQAGGVAGVVATHAESIISGFAEADLPRLRRLFTSLAAPDRDGRFVRRPVRMAELPADLAPLVAPLVSGRLLVVERVGEIERLQLAHQALIAHWPRLAGWLDDDRAFLAWRDQLEQQRDRWEATSRDDGALLRGTALAAAQEWLPRRVDDVAVPARDYVTRSVSRQRREVRRWRVVTAVLAVLALAAGALTVATVISRDEIDRQLSAANAQLLAQTASERSSTDPALATRLALTAYRLDPANTAAREAVMRQASTMRSVVGMTSGLSARPLTDVAVSPDTGIMLFGDEHGVAFTEPGAAQPVRHDLAGFPSDFLAARGPSSQPRVVTAVAGDGSVLAWDLDAPDRHRVLAGPGSATRNIFRTTDDSRFGWLDAGRRITIVDNRTGEVLANPSWTVDPRARAFGLTPDPGLITLRVGQSSLSQGQLELRSLADGALVRSYPEATAVVRTGTSLLTCVNDAPGSGLRSVAVVQDLVTGAEQRRIALSNSCPVGGLGPRVSADTRHLVLPWGGTPGNGVVMARIVSLDDGRSAEYALPPDTTIAPTYSSDPEAKTIGDTVAVLPPTADGPTEAVGIRATGLLRLRGAPTAMDPTVAAYPGPRPQFVYTLAEARVGLVDVRTSERTARTSDLGPEVNLGGFLSDERFLDVLATVPDAWRLDRYALPDLTPAGSLVVPRAPGEGGYTAMDGTADRTVLLAGGRLQVLGEDGRQVGEPLVLATTPAERAWFRGTAKVEVRPGHPDQVAVIGPGGIVTLWDLAARRRIADLPRQDVRMPEEIEFSPDGSRLVARTADGTLDTWSVDPPAAAYPPVRIGDGATLAGYTARGEVLTYRPVGGDGTVVSWDVASGRPTGKLEYGSQYTQPSVAENGTELVLAANPGFLPWRFPLDPQRWVDQLCRFAGTPFSAAERAGLPPGVQDESPCA